MRGTPCCFGGSFGVSGIIPAHAGNTHTATFGRTGTRDHPRACGEHITTSPGYRIVKGSSPRMRGTRKSDTIQPTSAGIIPAHAGNTSMNASMASMTRDHPRACGEHFCSASTIASTIGSSPRMRGTLQLVLDFDQLCGIIPAHAGNTGHSVHPFPSLRDHPRACGEHAAVPLSLVGIMGSSPRMRGTPVRRRPDNGRARIIPAHAGNTRASWRTWCAAGDHPRACGEHLI